MARLRLRVDFEASGSLGPGKVSLLEAIGRTGSISAAAREMGMSYRRAWLLVDATNALFRQAVVSTSAGGKHGGGAELTAFGRELIARFRAIEAEARRALDAQLAALEAELAEPGVPGRKPGGPA
jgi:molybdate transport system regulatory protein